ncbi:hypothetical protein Aduo_012428 [Ancylostoma duodenale]
MSRLLHVPSHSGEGPQHGEAGVTRPQVIAPTTSTTCLSPLQAVPAQSGSAGSAHSWRRRNHRAVSYHRKRTRVSHLIACTYNCRSVSSAAQLSALIEEAQRIKYDVIGLSETKRKEPLTCTWNNGTAVFLGARKTGSTSGGVGFIVAPNFARNITSATFYGHRLAVLTASLSKDIDVSIIQAYASTADRDEEEHNEFYSDLGDLVRFKKSTFIVVMGDFNARIGPRKVGEVLIGPNSAEQRNEAGVRLANFFETHHLFHGNSQFMKNPAKRWTYMFPNGQHYHELDHILCSKRVITNVGVVPSFNMGSDHRLLRAWLHFDRGQVRLVRVRSRRPRPTVLNEEMVRAIAAKEGFEMVDDVNEDYAHLVGTIVKIRNECRAAAPNYATRRISSSTRAVRFGPNHYILSPGEEVPPFLTSEVRKAPGADGITVGLLHACGPTLYTALARRFSHYLAKCEVPTAWKQSSTILLFKKGDKEDLENYRPITLLAVLYEVFTRCILTRIRRTLDEAQPLEQAGFRRKFSTLDHIITCCRLIEAAREYQEPLVLAFIDYKKAFDSVEPARVWKALEEQGVEMRYTKLLNECYSGCTTVFRPFLNDIEVSVVRQGDPVSPNLFAACLESVIRNCDWSTSGVLIDGKRLNHLRFADEIVLITRSPDDASEMLRQLDEEGRKAGLNINTRHVRK